MNLKNRVEGRCANANLSQIKFPKLERVLMPMSDVFVFVKPC
jgi:hypothetical protein